jgi:hypothetical protein
MAATASAEPWLKRVVAQVCERVDAGRRVVAGLVDMAESTLRSWCAAASRIVVPRRGRPALLADRLQRNDIYTVIHAAKGRIGVTELKAAYPDVGRSQLRHCLQRYRRLMRKRRRRGLFVLDWTQPGTVWAMDHTDEPVEDLGSHLLVVRDLASGKTLATEPVSKTDASSTIAVLLRLFAEHGPPLVLKSDNGPGFIAEATKAMLAEWGVLPLYSPPATPQYNGTCEAGLGGIVHRAEDAARQRGPDALMTLDDLALARAQADAQRVRRQAGSPTRLDLWRQRRPVSDALRARLRDRVDQRRAALRTERGIASTDELAHAEQASLDRLAIGQALRDLNLLNMTRRA